MAQRSEWLSRKPGFAVKTTAKQGIFGAYGNSLGVASSLSACRRLATGCFRSASRPRKRPRHGTPRTGGLWVRGQVVKKFEKAAADGVVLTGTRNDMPECYAAADIFVTASWREGFPRSAMEAASMGLATVATDIRGNRQVIADGQTGLLVPVRDPVAIAAAVEQLVGDARMRSTMGAAARVRAAAEFDQQRIIDRTLDAYRTLPR